MSGGPATTTFLVSLISFFLGLAVLWVAIPAGRGRASTTREPGRNLPEEVTNSPAPMPASASTSNGWVKEIQPDKHQKAILTRSTAKPAPDRQRRSGGERVLSPLPNRATSPGALAADYRHPTDSLRATPRINQDTILLMEAILDLSRRSKSSARGILPGLSDELFHLKVKFATSEILEAVSILHSRGLLDGQEVRKLRAFLNFY